MNMRTRNIHHLQEYERGVVLALEVAHHCFLVGDGVDQIENILNADNLQEALNATFNAGPMLSAIERGFTDTFH